MTTEQMKAEMRYNATMSILNELYRRGMLTDTQYAAAEKKLSSIYMPPVSGLLSQKHCNT